MFQRFCFSVDNKAGVVSKTLILLSKNGFKVGQHTFYKTESVLIVDLESEAEVSVQELKFIRDEIQSVLSIECLDKKDEVSEEIPAKPPESETDSHQPGKLYRGREITAPDNHMEEQNTGSPQKQVHIYRGKVVDETPTGEKEHSQNVKNGTSRYYRGQKLG
jgi:acetolactate synthase small subunit